MKKFFNGKGDVNGIDAARSGDAQATDRRNEKRRVLLNKNNVKFTLSKDTLNESYTETVNNDLSAGAPAGVVSVASGVLWKLQNANKRVLAVVLAIAMVVSLFAGVGIHFVTKAATTKESIPFKSDNTYTVKNTDNYTAGNEYYYNDNGKTYSYIFDADLIAGDNLTFNPDTKDISWSRDPKSIFAGRNYTEVVESGYLSLDESSIEHELTLKNNQHLDANKVYFYQATDGKAYAFKVDNYLGFQAATNLSSSTTNRNYHVNGSSTKNYPQKIAKDVLLTIDTENLEVSLEGLQLQRETAYVKKTTPGINNNHVYLVIATLDGKQYILQHAVASSQSPSLCDMEVFSTLSSHCDYYKSSWFSNYHTIYPLVTNQNTINVTNQIVLSGTLYDEQFNANQIENYIIAGLPGQDVAFTMAEFLATTSSTSGYSHLGGYTGQEYDIFNLALGKIGSNVNSSDYVKAYVYNRCSEHLDSTKWTYTGNNLNILKDYNISNFTTLHYSSSANFTFGNVGSDVVNLYELQEVYEPVSVNSTFVDYLEPDGGTFEASDISYSDTMTNGDNGLELDKSISKDDDAYKVHLEAFQKTPTLTLPETDVALVFDTSSNMSNVLFNWRYTNLATHPIFTQIDLTNLTHDSLYDEDDYESGLATVLGNLLADWLAARDYKLNKYVEDPSAPGTYVYLHQKYTKPGTGRNSYDYSFTSSNGDHYQTETYTNNILEVAYQWLTGGGRLTDGLKFYKNNTSASVTIKRIYKRTGTNEANALTSNLKSYGRSTVSATKLYIRDDYGVMCPVTLSQSGKMWTYATTDSKGQEYRFTTGNKTANDGLGVFQGLYKVTNGTVDYRPSARMLSKTLYVDNGEGSTAGVYTRLLAEKEAAEDFLYHVYAQAQKGVINISVTNYDTAANTQYHRSLARVEDSSYAEIDQMIANIYNYEASSSKASQIDAGMTDAYNQLNSKSAKNRKFAVLFSGGVPADYSTNWFGRDNSSGDFDTNVATTAIQYAYRIKYNLKGTVYSIGMFENANSAENKTYGNKFYYGNAWLHPPVNCNGRVGSAWGRTGLANLIINGLELSIDPMDAAATNRMLNYISSDHANASQLGLDRYDGFWNRLNPGNYWFTLGGKGYKVTKVESRTDNGHYFGVSSIDVEEVNSSDDDAAFQVTHTASAEEIQTVLNTVLQAIEAQTAVPNTTLTKDASLVDGVTEYFKLDEDFSEDDITAYITTINGTEPVTLEGVTLIKRVNGKTVTVTGFPYTQYYNQYKLNVDFNIKRRDGLIGGNSIPTNLSKSAVYDQDGVMEEQFEIPKVDLPIDMEDTENPITLDQATYYASDADLLDTINPYWIDGSNNEFVDITYSIFIPGQQVPINTYTVLAGNSEGTWATPASSEATTAATNPQLKDTTTYVVRAFVNARSNDDRLADGKIKNATYDNNEATAYVYKPHFDVFNDKVAHSGDSYTVTDIPSLTWELTDEVSSEKRAELDTKLAEKREPTVTYDVKQGETTIATVTEESVDVTAEEDGHTFTETVRQKSLADSQTGSTPIRRTTVFKVDNVRVTPNPVTYEHEQVLSIVRFDSNGAVYSVTTYDVNEQAQTPTYYNANGEVINSADTSRSVDNSKTQTNRGMATKSYTRPIANATTDGKVTYLNTLANVPQASITETMWEDASPARTNGEYTISAGVPYKLHIVKKFAGPMTVPEGVKFTITGGGTTQEVSITNFSQLTGEASQDLDLVSDEDYTIVETFLNNETDTSKYTVTAKKTLDGDNVDLTEKAETANQIDFDFSVTTEDIENLEERVLTITVTNTDETEPPIPTGFSDVASHLNPFFIAAAIVALLGGSGTAYAVKRKRETEE